MLYRVSLNGSVLADLPDGLQEMSLNIERDDAIDGLFYRYSSSIDFVGDGYTTLKNLYDQGYCSLVDVLIEWKCAGDKAFSTLFEGIITLSKVKFNLSKCIASVSVTDNTISARIVNNWRVKAILQTDRSINGVAISAATQTSLDFFTPTTGTFTDVNRASFSVFECFRFLIDYITDGEVDFASNTFGSGGDWEHLYVIRGAAIKVGGTYFPVEINLDDLYKEINNKIPLGIWVEDNNGTPRVRVEERSYFYGTTNVMTCRNIHGDDGLEASTDEDSIYSVVQFGCEVVTPQGGTFNYPDTRWQGWTKEEYAFATDCNLDNPLELISLWYMDSNTIEDIVVNGSADYDDEIFLVEGRFNSPNYEAIPYSDAITTYYYNRELTNYKVAQRYADFIPASFQKWIELSTVDNLFKATPGTDTSPTAVSGVATTLNADPFPFDTEVYDRGANYDGATNFRYTVPVVGVYSFRVYTSVAITAVDTVNSDMDVTCNIRRYNSSNVLQETISQTFSIPYNTYDLQFFTIGTFTCAANDYVNVKLEAIMTSGNANAIVKAESFFEATAAPTKVVSFEIPETPKLRAYSYQYPMSKTNWESILANLNGTITINPGNDTADDIVCHITNINYRPSEGIADFELIA